MTQPKPRPIVTPGPEIFGPLPELTRIPDTPDRHRFTPVSLGNWLSLCQQQRIPHVPAVQVGYVNRYDILLQDQEPHRSQAVQALERANQLAGPGEMLRYDCCAGIETKLLLAEGHSADHSKHRSLHIGDPRAYDVFMEYPRERIPIWKRPWITAKTINDYPVEYRAFVEDGRLLGISNYYPQRPIEYDHRHITAVTTFTKRLANTAPTPFLWTEAPDIDGFLEQYDGDAAHFTADFIVTSDDQVEFLEGGPPHALGAHPCCFVPFQTEGIALSDRNAKVR